MSIRVSASPCKTALILAVLIFGLGVSAGALGAPTARSVIVMIADGCSGEQYTFARWFKGEPLSLDAIRVGAVKTHISDSVIADSAPAATAFATGFRTNDKFIGVGPKSAAVPDMPAPPESLRFRPLATVLEGARLLNKATGIVATSRVTHATPGAYVAHVPHRGQENEIMEQAVHQDLDVVFGGGMQHLLPKTKKGKRTDGEDLAALLQERGYRIVETREEMMEVASGKVFGLFASSHMDAEIDREKAHPHQPTLEEMTKKAIQLLSQDPDGFFLMVEGSQIDWACHANDPGHLVSDMLAYDRAVKAALDFAVRDGYTLVLALSDHNTGGFAIGNRTTDRSYSQLTAAALLDPVRRMKASTAMMWKRIEKDKTPETVMQVVREDWGMDITQEDAKAILSLADIYTGYLYPYYALGRILCPKYTALGWTTHGHCGGDVPLHAFGPGSPGGVLDGPEIGKISARALGLDLGKLNERLFVEAREAFSDSSVGLDRTDPENPVVRIEFKGKEACLPVHKNILKTEEREVLLEGIVVYAAGTDRIYIPLQAVHLIRGLDTPLPSVAAQK